MAKVDIATLNKVKAEASQQVVKAVSETKVISNKPKGGRPKKEVKAEERVVLLLTSDEMQKYQEFCAQNGVTQGGYIRFLLKQQNAI